MTKETVITILLIGFISPVLAGGGAGIRLKLNQFVLDVRYNDNLVDDESIAGMDYIRRPDGLLFDLIALVQFNKEVILKKKHTARIYIYNGSGSISASTNKGFKAYDFESRLPDTGKKTIDRTEVLHFICEALDLKTHKCNTNIYRTYMYLSDTNTSEKTGDLIFFGVFGAWPAGQYYTLTERWINSDTNAQPPIFKKVELSRESIFHYFNLIT